MFRQIVFFIRLCKLIAVTRYSDNVKRQYEIDKAGFEALLSLLSDDREEAGRLYERLRLGLIRFFQARGCSDCTGLADETLNRVAVKIGDFDPKLNNKPTSFIFGFAAKVFLNITVALNARSGVLNQGRIPLSFPAKIMATKKMKIWTNCKNAWQGYPKRTGISYCVITVKKKATGLSFVR